MKNEIWKTIQQEDNYEVSNTGNIRSKYSYYNSTYKGKPVIRKKKTLLVGKKLSQKGYPRVNLNNKIYFVHVIVASTFIKNINNYPQVNHKNGIKTDNRVENLEWVTNRQNKDHAVKNNLIAYGEDLSHLNSKDILKIRKMYSTGNFTQEELGKMFNVCQQSISRIILNKGWKRLRFENSIS